MMIFGPFLYAGFVNVAYTSGPILDMVCFRGTPRRSLFKAGYIFSLVLTALRGAWACCGVAYHCCEQAEVVVVAFRCAFRKLATEPAKVHLSR